MKISFGSKYLYLLFVVPKGTWQDQNRQFCNYIQCLIRYLTVFDHDESRYQNVGIVWQRVADTL